MNTSIQKAIPVYLIALSVCVSTAWSGNRIVAWGSGSNHPGNKDVTTISAGLSHSLAVTSSGEVLAWGDNGLGQCDVVAGLPPIASVAAGGLHSLAVTRDGRVVAWGDNAAGQSTVPPGAATKVAAVSAGLLHSLALGENGRVAAWGDNQFGQILVPPPLNQVVEISAGAFHSVALRAGGDVVVWGDNTYWQSLIPPKAQAGVISVSAGYYHTLALTKDGEVIAWGDNTFGQSDVPVAARSNIVAISAGQNQSLALRMDGTLVSWGDNDAVQPLGKPGRARLAAISAGGFHSLGLVPADADSNGNGIPDWWMIDHGLDPLSAANPLRDSDGDGFTDLEEYLAGTHPTDADSYLKMAIVPGTEQTPRHLRIEGASSGRVYTLEVNTNLGSGEWQAMTSAMSVDASNGAGVLSITSDAPFAVYRVRVGLSD